MSDWATSVTGGFFWNREPGSVQREACLSTDPTSPDRYALMELLDEYGILRPDVQWIRITRHDPDGMDIEVKFRTPNG